MSKIEDVCQSVQSMGEKIGAAENAGDWRSAARHRMRMQATVFGVGRFFRRAYWKLVWTTFDEVMDMATRQNWRCAVTGIRFADGKVEGAHARPYMASIDRIKCNAGYTRANSRLVCIAVNLALSSYGEAVFGHLARRYVAKAAVR